MPEIGQKMSDPISFPNRGNQSLHRRLPIYMNCMAQARVFVVAGPREKFSETEINHMKKFLEEGGSILVLLGEGGEKR